MGANFTQFGDDEEAETEDTEERVNLGVVAMSAGLMIKAGLTMMADGDTLRLPERGWAPPPAQGSEAIEYGAALAVQALMSTFELDPIDVNRVADALIERAVG